MSTFKYTVKARDNAGNAFVHTFRHPVDARMHTDNAAFTWELAQNYQSYVLNAAPFRCFVCGDAAKGLHDVETSHFDEKDPIMFSTIMPMCLNPACVSICHAKAGATYPKLLHGEADCSCAACPADCILQRSHEKLTDSHLKLDVCVVCGESQVQKCAGCKIIPYCSRGCQKRHWPSHRPWCNAAAQGLRLVLGDVKPGSRVPPRHFDAIVTFKKV